MSDYYENMFQVPLVHIEVRNWIEKQKEIIEYYKDINLEKYDTILTNYYNDNNGLNEFIQTLFDDELDLFLNKLDVGTKTVHSSWFETAGWGNYHKIHTHGAYGYSAVCFVKFDKSVHEPTVFLSPFLNFFDGNVLNYTPKVDEGSLIFFPSSIIHYTNPNNSQKDRIILSFNIRD